jgi:hypothetical protein
VVGNILPLFHYGARALLLPHNVAVMTSLCV